MASSLPTIQQPPKQQQQRPIQRLKKEVVDRIAAGEVVQRPSAALKELLENSIDAKARRIQVTVQDGGLSLLQIVDDGTGIGEADLPLLCERFATSKLSQFEDLLSMSTFGFRGEALASISHVAKVSVVTKTPDARYALKACYSDGKLIGRPAPTAGNAGTMMTIEDLFYNIQVRRKALLEKVSEEHSRVTDVIVKYAFAFPHIGFSLKKLGPSTTASSAKSSVTVSAAAMASARIEFNFPEKSSTLANLKQYYGVNISKALHSFGHSDTPTATVESDVVPSSAQHPITFTGYASDLSLTHRRAIFILFINNRLVESSALKRAVDQAYASYLVNDNKPFVFLSVSVPPERVDVNVHPTKHEVLLLDEERVCQLLHTSLASLLRGAGDSIVAGSTTERGSGKGDSQKGSALLGMSSVNKPAIDPQIINLKPVAGQFVQVAASTMSRPVVQRGDLLRLFKSAKERTEQQQLISPSPVEDDNYFRASSNSGEKPRPPPSHPLSIQPSKQVPHPNTLRIDAVMDLTELPDSERGRAIGSRLGNKRQRGQEDDPRRVLDLDTEEEGAHQSTLLSLQPINDVDEGSNSNVALAFAPAINSDDEDEAAGTLYDDGDRSMRLASAMANFNEYLTLQQGEGEPSAPIITQKAAVAPKPQPAVTMQLAYVGAQLVQLNALTSPEAKHMFRSLTYVGILNHQHILAQSGTSLLMLDWKPIVRSVARQRLITRWGRHRLVSFDGPSCPRVVDGLSAAMEDPNCPAVATTTSLLQQLQVLNDWREMYAEYFGIVLGYPSTARASPSPLQDLRLVALPSLVGEAWPVNQAAVPALLHRLATQIDYSNEDQCLEGIVEVVADTIGSNFFFLEPSAVLSNRKQKLSPNRSPYISSITNPSIITAYPHCHEKFVDAVQGALLPALASTSLYMPPTAFLADGSIKTVVTVEALYKVFERC